jgi:hypothetical protein
MISVIVVCFFLLVVVIVTLRHEGKLSARWSQRLKSHLQAEGKNHFREKEKAIAELFKGVRYPEASGTFRVGTGDVLSCKKFAYDEGHLFLIISTHSSGSSTSTVFHRGWAIYRRYHQKRLIPMGIFTLSKLDRMFTSTLGYKQVLDIPWDVEKRFFGLLGRSESRKTLSGAADEKFLELNQILPHGWSFYSGGTDLLLVIEASFYKNGPFYFPDDASLKRYDSILSVLDSLVDELSEKTPGK